ncbi:hypothetical protein BB560_003362 [Smittium megazygosporum]|uniref:Uncharacterized protein n=1 Tax=Smittium megazygosporum TaxID=133381 RepID=A0A2T9ZCB9_9FUNG|nr:hypothetical protein BB560_003362 [Smittium megazygosporum]
MGCKSCKGWTGKCCLERAPCGCLCHLDCNCSFCEVSNLISRNPSVLVPTPNTSSSNETLKYSLQTKPRNSRSKKPPNLSIFAEAKKPQIEDSSKHRSISVPTQLAFKAITEKNNNHFLKKLFSTHTEDKNKTLPDMIVPTDTATSKESLKDSSNRISKLEFEEQFIDSLPDNTFKGLGNNLKGILIDLNTFSIYEEGQKLNKNLKERNIIVLNDHPTTFDNSFESLQFKIPDTTSSKEETCYESTLEIKSPDKELFFGHPSTGSSLEPLDLNAGYFQRNGSSITLSQPESKESERIVIKKRSFLFRLRNYVSKIAPNYKEKVGNCNQINYSDEKFVSNTISYNSRKPFQDNSKQVNKYLTPLSFSETSHSQI